MTSLLSVLSLLILVLANGYFAVPIGDDERTTTPLLQVDLTADKGVQLHLVPDGETSTLSIPEHTQPTEQSTEATMTNSILTQFQEKVSQAARLFNEAVTTETTTVEQSTSTDLPFTTLESSTNDLVHHQRETEDVDESKREHHEDDENNQVESEAAEREILDESTTLTALLFTSTSSAVAPHLYTTDSSSTTESTTTTTESTTTTTTVTSQPDTLETSTEKYTGLLKDDQEEPEKPTKPVKKQPKKPKVNSEDKSEEESQKKPKVKSEDKSEEEYSKKPIVKSDKVIKGKQVTKPKYDDDDDSKDSTAPIAVYDQKALKDVSPIPNGVMILDENNDLVVTDIPEKISKIKTEQKEKEKQLNQGKKSSHSEEEKSDK